MPGAVGGPTDLARYRILRLLGRGGLGEVYLAHDDTLDRKVAIKFVAPDHLLDASARRRLLREARVSAGLDHPGICAVYEAGETADGRGYIVMQYIEGETLDALLERGPMSPPDALVLCAQIAEALGAAHRKGVIHRDLKPANVLVTQAGRPVLVDFGIARIVVTGARASDLSAVTTTTTQGVIGTPAYMSPEQIQQHRLDGRSDLFSLGLILFECFTGHRAFEGRSPLDTAAAVLHVHPPAPSTRCADLTAAHDDLCGRLIAKAPADRFQSADEVIGAIRLLISNTSTGIPPSVYGPRRFWRRPIAIALALLLLAGAAGGAWAWSRRGRLPAVPPEAKAWSDRGTEAIREGAYQTGRKELEQAIALFPQHALAYARLAEADMELDDPTAAQEPLLRVSALVPDESRLPATERLRLKAVRALVLRDVDQGVAAYRQLVAHDSGDAGAWLDLGRSQEAAGLQADARDSYEAAIARNQQYAAAWLQLGTVNARAARREESLSAFHHAEQLYHARSDIEGETQVLLARGNALDGMGELVLARGDLERALRLASDSRTFYQQVRARLALSSVTASEGRYADAQAQASLAVDDALAKGLDTIAAGGLVDLSATLLQQGHPDQAESDARRALQLAEQHGARLTAARARTQLASVYNEADRSDESLAVLADVLPFLKANQYRRTELTALSIASRAHERLDHLEEARQISSAVLHNAEIAKEDGQIALAAANLASIDTTLGAYPAALALRARAEAIHRRLGDQASLPYDLTNRADVLIRLGRVSEADGALAELDAGIAKGLDSYVGRRRRALFLRAMTSATTLRCDTAVARFRDLQSGEPQAGAARVWTPAMASFCQARLGHLPPGADASLHGVEPSYAREAHYWRGAAALAARDPKRALAEARAGLSLLGALANDELRWRLAAIGAIAARRLDDAAAAGLEDTARAALDRLQREWGQDAAAYEHRGDLAELGSRAGLF